MMTTLDMHGNGLIKLVESTLTDGSSVFDVWIGDAVVVCLDSFDARELFDKIAEHTIITSTTDIAYITCQGKQPTGR